MNRISDNSVALVPPQLGYEPMKPRMGKTLFGQPALLYPNVFQYGE